MYPTGFYSFIWQEETSFNEGQVLYFESEVIEWSNLKELINEGDPTLKPIAITSYSSQKLNAIVHKQPFHIKEVLDVLSYDYIIFYKNLENGTIYWGIGKSFMENVQSI
jgi:hypothetical protein